MGSRYACKGMCEDGTDRNHGTKSVRRRREMGGTGNNSEEMKK